MCSEVYKLSVVSDVEMKFDLLRSVVRSRCLARNQIYTVPWRNLGDFFVGAV